MRGYLDLGIDRHRISGWAQDPLQPDVPVHVVLTDNGAPLARVVANRHRDDLAAAGIGSGRHSFDLYLSHPLSALERHVIRATVEGSGFELCDSPILIEAATGLDPAVELSIARYVAAAEPTALERAHTFLSTQIDAIRQRRAHHASHHVLRHFAHSRFRHRGEPARDEHEAPEPPCRVLVIVERLPSGGAAADVAFESGMRSLIGRGCEVTLAAAEPILGAESGRRMREAGAIVAGAADAASVEELLRRQAGAFDGVILHQLAVAARYLPLVRHYCARARVSYWSFEGAWGLERPARPRRDGLPICLADRHERQDAERACLAQVDGVLTTSPADAARLARLAPNAVVDILRGAAADATTAPREAIGPNNGDGRIAHSNGSAQTHPALVRSSPPCLPQIDLPQPSVSERSVSKLA